MPKLIRLAIAASLTLPFTAGAQTPAAAPKAPAMAHEEMSGWKELDAFHDILRATWHPAGKGDLAPARAKAEALHKAAEAWAASKGPASCDDAAMRKALPEIVADTKAVAAKGTDDATLKAALKKAHDAFENAAERCMMKH